MNVGRVCFETSLKPFKKIDDEYIESVCVELFEQWKPLIDKATGIAVMLWTSDGSEILDYSGDINDEFEWGRYIGIGNPKCVERIPGTIWFRGFFMLWPWLPASAPLRLHPTR